MTTHTFTTKPDTTIAYGFLVIAGLFIGTATIQNDIAIGITGIIIATTAYTVLSRAEQ